MSKTIATAVFALAATFTCAYAQDVRKVSAQVIDKQAKVTGVNKPGDAAFTTFKVANGDKIEFTKYKPNKDDKSVGIVKGTTYNMFMITQKDKSQAFIVWSPDEPKWQDRLSKTNTTIRGLGVGSLNDLRRGDECHVSVQSAKGGGTDVTLDVWRNRKSVATFSFVVK